MLTLEDSGPGIKREHLNHLFDSFFTTKDVGIGLGLRISRSIVEGHGGCIGADDESAVWRRSFQLHIAGEAALAGRAPAIQLRSCRCANDDVAALIASTAASPRAPRYFMASVFIFDLRVVCVKGLAGARPQPEVPFGQQRFCQASEG
jgi:signal transduction histidine kinase